MPGLGSRDRVVIDEGNHRNTGQGGDQPANAGPHDKNVDAEFVGGVEEDGGFDLAAERNQQGGKRHGHKSENYQ